MKVNKVKNIIIIYNAFYVLISRVLSFTSYFTSKTSSKSRSNY